MLRDSNSHSETRNPKIILTRDSTDQTSISLPLNALCKPGKQLITQTYRGFLYRIQITASKDRREDMDSKYHHYQTLMCPERYLDH